MGKLKGHIIRRVNHHRKPRQRSSVRDFKSRECSFWNQNAISSLTLMHLANCTCSIPIV